MTIYKVTNKTNGLVYIGQTKLDGKTRFNTHVREANSKARKNYGLFHNAILEFGKDEFYVEDIETGLSPEEADERERYWISVYKSNDVEFGYNVDSGGLSGGKKGSSCIELMRESTKKIWQDEGKAIIMKEALQRGADKMKEKKQRYEWKCPVCGKIILLEGYDARKRKYCSNKCVARDKQWKTGVEKAATAIHERNLERKAFIKEDIIKWCEDNRDIVLNCPKNKIKSSLSGLLEMIYAKYGIKDIRSLFVCFDVKNNKELIRAMQLSIS